MAQKTSTQSGQALPEYLLILLALVIVATLGLKAVRYSLAAAEEEQAFYYALPSP